MKSRTALRLLPSSTDTQVSACVHVATGSITGNRAGRWRGGRVTLSRQTLLQTDCGIVPVFGDFRLFCINIEDCFVIRKELWILSIQRKQTQYLLVRTCVGGLNHTHFCLLTLNIHASSSELNNAVGILSVCLTN